MNKGLIYGLLAAMFNASVGTFSIWAFDSGGSSISVAFYKCFVALMVLTPFVFLNKDLRKQCAALSLHTHKIAVLSLCGIFLLYYFETSAYQYNSIAIIVFTLQATSTIFTFIGSQFILKIHHSKTEWLSMFLALAGLMILYFSSDLFSGFNAGVLLAAVAGMGYGLFLVLSKKTALPYQGVALLWWLLLFGSSFLLIPFGFEGIYIPSYETSVYIACLGFLGTIGGFYFTIKALFFLKASKVQLCELSEPFFASLLGLIFFNQWLTIPDIIGALMIFASIFMLNREKEPIPCSKEMEKFDENDVSCTEQ